MNFDNFLAKFRQYGIRIFIEPTPEFKQICQELERCGFSVSPGSLMGGEENISIYDYAMKRCNYRDFTSIGQSRNFADTVTAWMTNDENTVHASDIIGLGELENEFAAILEGGAL